jgi:phosphoribosylformylglycinamidine synthase
LGGLVRASQACYDIAKAYGVPFISGKDSLNNEYSAGGKTISIPPTLLISCISVVDDISRCITMDLKKPGNALYMVGLTYDELGGSQYYKMNGFVGNDIPKVDAARGKYIMSALSRTIANGRVASCHDCSEGGMAVAIAEMAFAGGIGAEVDLSRSLPPKGQVKLDDIAMLFSESNTRFIVEVSDEKGFLRDMSRAPVWRIGSTSNSKELKVIGLGKKILVKTNLDSLRSAWKEPFKGF